MSDSTQTTRLPNKVTSHRGIESKNPTSLILVMISAGNVVALAAVNPEALMAEPIVPCTMLKMAIRNSSPKSIKALANTKRINNLNACSGLFSSAKLPAVFITPMVKNNTNNAYPIAYMAPWMFMMTAQILPPLKLSGPMVMSCQISASFSFHTDSAEFKLSTIQFPEPTLSLLSYRLLFSYQPVTNVKISLAKVITIPPRIVSMALERCEAS